MVVSGEWCGGVGGWKMGGLMYLEYGYNHALSPLFP